MEKALASLEKGFSKTVTVEQAAWTLLLLMVIPFAFQIMKEIVGIAIKLLFVFVVVCCVWIHYPQLFSGLFALFADMGLKDKIGGMVKKLVEQLG